MSTSISKLTGTGNFFEDFEVGAKLRHARGTTIVWVEHVIRVLIAVATRLVCLADGQVIADGVPATVLASDEVRAAYLGGGVL